MNGHTPGSVNWNPGIPSPPPDSKDFVESVRGCLQLAIDQTYRSVNRVQSMADRAIGPPGPSPVQIPRAASSENKTIVSLIGELERAQNELNHELDRFLEEVKV